MSDTKICPKCQIDKPYTEFSKNKHTKDGYERVCKECDKVYRQEYTSRIKAYRVEYRQNNKERIKKYAVNKKQAFYAMTHEEMEKIVHYDPTTGDIVGVEHPASVIDEGDYWRVCLLGTRVPAHRLAWFLMYKKWVPYIDHIDGDGHNNRLSNLRECSIHENGCNRAEHRNGHLIGAHFDKRRNLWRSHIQIDGKLVSLGNSFSTEREASLAYCIYVTKNGLVRREFLPTIFTDEELYGEEK